jgi:transcription initiation factor IIE alpha subunit
VADSFLVGNLKVTKLVGQEQIDTFVASLPQNKKADVKDVIVALHEAGLIDIEEQNTD